MKYVYVGRSFMILDWYLIDHLRYRTRCAEVTNDVQGTDTLTCARRKRKKKSQTFREKYVEKNRTRHESDSPQGDRDERRTNPETMDASCCHQGAAHLPLWGKGRTFCERWSWSTVWKLQNFLPATRRVWQQLRKKWRPDGPMSRSSHQQPRSAVAWSLKDVSNTFLPFLCGKKDSDTRRCKKRSNIIRQTCFVGYFSSTITEVKQAKRWDDTTDVMRPWPNSKQGTGIAAWSRLKEKVRTHIDTKRGEILERCETSRRRRREGKNMCEHGGHQKRRNETARKGRPGKNYKIRCMMSRLSGVKLSSSSNTWWPDARGPPKNSTASSSATVRKTIQRGSTRDQIESPDPFNWRARWHAHANHWGREWRGQHVPSLSAWTRQTKRKTLTTSTSSDDCCATVLEVILQTMSSAAVPRAHPMSFCDGRPMQRS